MSDKHFSINYYNDFLIYLQLYYLRLPKDIKDYRVILMDATGNLHKRIS